jgi:uncharacterized membrane protein YesL
LVLNRFTSAASDHLLLSLLWLAGCLPVVTVPASTAALFEVTRQRTGGDDVYPWRSYVAAFRQYARPTLALGLGWAALGAVLAVDLAIVTRMRGSAGDVLVVALLAVLILYALVSAALLPVVVSFDAPPRDQLRTAVLVAVLSPVRGPLAVAAVAGAVFVVWTVPVAILLLPSLVATVIMRLYRGAFQRLGRPQASPSLTPLAMSHQRR